MRQYFFLLCIISSIICSSALFYGFRMRHTEILRKYRLRQNDISKEIQRIICKNIAIYIFGESIDN